jgi:hypothetical protein
MAANESQKEGRGKMEKMTNSHVMLTEQKSQNIYEKRQRAE